MTLRRLSSRANGQSMVEMAIVIPILLLLLLVIIDVGRCFYQYTWLRGTLEVASEYTAKGRKTTPGTSRLVSIQTVVAQTAAQGGIPAPTVTFVDSNGNNTPGAPSTDVRIILTDTFTPLPPTAAIMAMLGLQAMQATTLTAEKTVRNEPYI